MQVDTRFATRQFGIVVYGDACQYLEPLIHDRRDNDPEADNQRTHIRHYHGQVTFLKWYNGHPDPVYVPGCDFNPEGRMHAAPVVFALIRDEVPGAEALAFVDEHLRPQSSSVYACHSYVLVDRLCRLPLRSDMYASGVVVRDVNQLLETHCRAHSRTSLVRLAFPDWQCDPRVPFTAEMRHELALQLDLVCAGDRQRRPYRALSVLSACISASRRRYGVVLADPCMSGAVCQAITSFPKELPCTLIYQQECYEVELISQSITFLVWISCGQQQQREAHALLTQGRHEAELYHRLAERDSRLHKWLANGCVVGPVSKVVWLGTPDSKVPAESDATRHDVCDEAQLWRELQLALPDLEGTVLENCFERAAQLRQRMLDATAAHERYRQQQEQKGKEEEEEDRVVELRLDKDEEESRVVELPTDNVSKDQEEEENRVVDQESYKAQEEEESRVVELSLGNVSKEEDEHLSKEETMKVGKERRVETHSEWPASSTLIDLKGRHQWDEHELAPASKRQRRRLDVDPSLILSEGTRRQRRPRH